MQCIFTIHSRYIENCFSLLVFSLHLLTSLLYVWKNIQSIITMCVYISHRVLFMNLILCNWNNSRVKQLRELHLVIIVVVSLNELLQQVSLTITCNFRMIVKSYSWWSEWGVGGGRERQNENVGNAKLESEKLIQQVFIMNAC